MKNEGGKILYFTPKTSATLLLLGSSKFKVLRGFIRPSKSMILPQVTIH
jgi:hypothetical protein